MIPPTRHASRPRLVALSTRSCSTSSACEDSYTYITVCPGIRPPWLTALPLLDPLLAFSLRTSPLSLLFTPLLSALVFLPLSPLFPERERRRRSHVHSSAPVQRLRAPAVSPRSCLARFPLCPSATGCLRTLYSYSYPSLRVPVRPRRPFAFACRPLARPRIPKPKSLAPS